MYRLEKIGHYYHEYDWTNRYHVESRHVLSCVRRDSYYGAVYYVRATLVACPDRVLQRAQGLKAKRPSFPIVKRPSV